MITMNRWHSLRRFALAILVSFAVLCATAGTALAVESTDTNTATPAATAAASGAPSSTYSTTWQRLPGINRYDTMQMLASRGFTTSDTVILSTGEKFPDALTASSFAGMLNCPIIMTASDSLSTAASDEISSLGAEKVYILGGEESVSSTVQEQVENLGCSVTRISGSNRVQTGIAVYESGLSQGSWSSTCIVTKGAVFADALSIAPYAYVSKSPIFLADDDGSISPAVASAIESGDFSRIIILGGTGSGGIADASASSLGLPWIRLSGPSRYDTSAAIVRWETGRDASAGFQPQETLSLSKMAVATGEKFPDGLASVDLLGPNRSALLLVTGNATTKTTIDELIHANDASIGNGFIIGGSSSVSNTVERWLYGLSAGTLRVHYINVGQGDSEFIELPDGKTMLIDAGPTDAGSTVVSYIRALGYSRIDYLVTSHPDEDHIGGMLAVIPSFDIGEIWAPKKGATTKTYEHFLDAVSAKGMSINTATAGKWIFSDSDCSAEILWPSENCSYSSANDWSAIVEIWYGTTSFLFPGDARASIIYNSVSDHVDVLKVSHHGSSTGTTAALVSRLSPYYAIISCGLNNSYGHPTAQTLALLSGSSVYRTDLQGTIVMSSDGSSITAV